MRRMAVLLAVVALLAAGCGSGGATPRTRRAGGEWVAGQRLIPTSPPPGLTLEVTGVTRMTWFGRGPVDVYRRGDTVVGVRAVAADRDAASRLDWLTNGAEGTHEVEVQGHPGVAASTFGDIGITGAPQVFWIDGRWAVAVAALHGSERDALDAAETVGVADDGSVDVPRFTHVGAVPAAPALGTDATLWSPHPGTAVGGDHNLSVVPVSRAEQAAIEATLRSSLGPLGDQHLEPITYRPPREVRAAGHDAVVGTVNWSTRVLVVEGDPGVAVFNSGNDEEHGAFLTDDQLVHVVEHLRPISEDDFTAMLDRKDRERMHSTVIPRETSRLDATAPGWKPVVIDSTGPVGERSWWMLSTGENAAPGRPAGGLCLESLSYDGGSATCVAPGQPADPVTFPWRDDGTVWWGTARAGVAAVRIEAPGQRIAGQLRPLDLGDRFPPQMFVIRWPIEQQIAALNAQANFDKAFLVVTDAAGHELLRAPITTFRQPPP